MEPPETRREVLEFQEQFNRILTRYPDIVWELDPEIRLLTDIWHALEHTSRRGVDHKEGKKARRLNMLARAIEDVCY
ncbi:hypothetical protein BDW59DRAFT_138366 [Aspergillus cavernicola]|uniref:Uncharacterized protein n=1 Tax=Aspergillus cavernicola TaxID=176166 RepID=A0ABR4IZM9_9EURO